MNGGTNKGQAHGIKLNGLVSYYYYYDYDYYYY